MHNQTGHKETRWFLTDMNGGVQFLGRQNSLTPKQLIVLVETYISSSTKFFENHKP